MTSSRLPIGVAQTASGIRPPASSASNATSPAPTIPADVPSSARTMRTESRIGFSASRSSTSRAGAEQQLARGREPAADDDQLRVERVDEAAEPRAELAPDLGEDLERRRVALVGEPDEPVRVGRRPERLARELVGRLAGDVRLEVPAAAAAAEDAVVDDHDVAELGAGADRAAVRPAAEDQPAADPGAEREHDHVASSRARRRRATRRSPPRSRRCRSPTGRPSRSRITSRSGTSTSGMFTEPIAIAGPLVDPRRDAEADRDDALVEQLAHGGLEAVEQRLLGVERRRVLAVREHRPVALDDAGEDLRPADVDADHVGSHGRRLP